MYDMRSRRAQANAHPFEDGFGWPRGVRPGTHRRFSFMPTDEETPAMKNPEKDPEKWTTGDEPMTGPQRSYLQTLCREANEEFNDKLTKAEASKKIDELRQKTGRGK